MPIGNNFEHSAYTRSNPGDRVRYGAYTPGAPLTSPAWQDAMASLGRQLEHAGIRAICWLHGSLLNSDPFGVQRLDEAGGLKRGYSRGIPGVDAMLALMREGSNGLPPLSDDHRPPFAGDDAFVRLLDTHAGDAGNFTQAAIDQVMNALNRPLTRPLSWRRICWSSAHHHLGRALATVALLEDLQALAPQDHGDRVLILAHGQAGLLLALLSNLLAPESSRGRRLFLDTLFAYAEALDDRSLREQLRGLEHAGESNGRLRGGQLDLVTLGTPIRYGWDSGGGGRLLHVVNHRPLRRDEKRWLAKMELPQITMEMPVALGGDYLQQLAVAGTDAVPSSPEAQAANKALWELLEPYDGFERWLECVRKGVRCQNDGVCLLLDYGDAGSASPPDHYYGHAAYTRGERLLFTLTEIVTTLYEKPAGSGASP